MKRHKRRRHDLIKTAILNFLFVLKSCRTDVEIVLTRPSVTRLLDYFSIFRHLLANENLLSSVKIVDVGKNVCPIIIKPYQKLSKDFIFCQSDEISPNLVALLTSHPCPFRMNRFDFTEVLLNNFSSLRIFLKWGRERFKMKEVSACASIISIVSYGGRYHF